MPAITDIIDFDGIDALIFDMDGTLIDTMPTHYVAWREAFAAHGITFDEDLFYAMGGIPAPKVAATVAASQNVEVDAHALAEGKEDRFLELMRSSDSVDLIEPVVAVARDHHGQRPMAVATGSPRFVAEVMLDASGLSAMFQTLVTADDTERHKPEPDVFLEAARRLNVEPTRCVVFEDADPGLEGARRAGMQAIDIRPHFTPRRVTG